MNTENAANFLKEMWCTIPEGFIEIRKLPNKKSSKNVPRQNWFNTVDEALEYGLADTTKTATFGTYFGVAKRVRRGRKKSDVLGVSSLWADIDTVNMGLDTDLCLRTLHDLPGALQPSAVIHSGGGLHAYWFLQEPLVGAEHFPSIEAANAELAAIVAGDNVGNVDRILRLPGSWNTKRGGSLARECEVAFHYYWRRCELGALLKAATQQPRLFASLVSKTIPNTQRISQRPASYSPLDLETLWLRKVRYHAPSGYIGVNEAIMRTVAKLHHAGWTTDRIVSEVLKRVKRVQASQAPDEPWDWEAERRQIEKSLSRLRSRLETDKSKKSLPLRSDAK